MVALAKKLARYPVNGRKRSLREVAAELEARRQAGEIGEGSVHRLARTIQRKYFGPPEIGESKYRRV
jgi:hypothetical protein